MSTARRSCEERTCPDDAVALVRVLDADGGTMVRMHLCGGHLKQAREALATRDPSLSPLRLEELPPVSPAEEVEERRREVEQSLGLAAGTLAVSTDPGSRMGDTLIGIGTEATR